MNRTVFLYLPTQPVKTYFYRVVGIGFCFFFGAFFAVAQRHEPVIFIKNKKNGNHEVRDFSSDSLVASYRKIREDYDIYGKKAGDPYIITDTLGRVGALDKFGNPFIPCEYDYIYQFRKGIAIAERDGAKGIINYQNKILLPFEYDEIVLSRVYYGLSDPKAYNLLANWNVVLVRRGTRWYWRTLQNELLNVVSPPPFDWDGGSFFYRRTKYYIQYFDETDRNFVFYTGKVSFAQARFNFKTLQEWEAYPKVAERDTLSISFPNDTLHVFPDQNVFQLVNDSLVILGNKKQFQLFQTNFTPIGDRYDTIIKPLNTNYSEWKITDNLPPPTDEYGRSLFFIVKKQAHYGVMNEKGQLVIPLIYDDISRIDSLLFLVKTGDKFGILDKTGNICLSVSFADRLERLSPVWFLLVKDKKIGLFHVGLHKLFFQDGSYGNYTSVANTGNNVLLCSETECAFYDSDGLRTLTIPNETAFKHYRKNEQQIGELQYNLFLFKQYEIKQRMYKKFPNLQQDSLYFRLLNENLIQVETPDNKYLIDTNNQQLTARYTNQNLRYANTISQIPLPVDAAFYQDSLFIYGIKKAANKVQYDVYYTGKFAPFHQVMQFTAPATFTILGQYIFAFYKKITPTSTNLELINLYKNAIDSTSYSAVLAEAVSEETRSSERIILTNKANFCGALTAEGAAAVPFRYDAMRHFNDGFARVRLNWHCGYVDKNGVEPIPLHFDYADDIKNKRALVFKDGVWIFLKL